MWSKEKLYILWLQKKYDFKIYYKLFYKYKNDQVCKKSFLIRYAKTKYIKKDKLFDSFHFSYSFYLFLRDIAGRWKLGNICH